MVKSKRNTAIVLLAAGVFILASKVLDFMTIAALVLLLIGVYRIASEPGRSGFVIAAIGLLILFGAQMGVVLALAMISIGVFYVRSKKKIPPYAREPRPHIIGSFKRDRGPWILKHTGIWCAIGEFRLDLSLAIPEEKETQIFLQGIIGDVHLILPEDWGVEAEAYVWMGEVKAAGRKEAGIANKFVWRSDNFDTCEHRVRLQLAFMIGDIDIRIL
ncbi:cell wall-active antibiotics response protein LiaF [Paenibacillus sp. y28]|uniref:cell wall-active antibiotics response protein LiaF n=1 Tax=Paenibacillus sp. y28 TaxID=3129110 RepID=UPI003019D5F3